MIRRLLAAVLALPCIGWASVTRGTTENISISTTPAAATAELSGLDNPTAGVTSCGRGERNADIAVTINKEGYEPQVIPLTKEIPATGAAGFAGNFLLGGLVGIGVDAAIGAAQDHKPNPVIATLQPLAPVPPGRKDLDRRESIRRRRRADATRPLKPATSGTRSPQTAPSRLHDQASRRLTRGPRLCDLMSLTGLAYLFSGIEP